jgi:hypothetical protein
MLVGICALVIRTNPNLGKWDSAVVVSRKIAGVRSDCANVIALSDRRCPRPGVGFQKEGTLAFQNLSPLTCPIA